MSDQRRADGDQPFRSLLDALPDATLLVRRDGRILMANKQAQAAFGYRAGELTGMPVGALVPGRFRSRHAALRAAYAAHPASRPMRAGLELVALRRDGSEFPAEISLSPLKSRGAAVFIAAVRDLTERRTAQLAREEERRWFLKRVIDAQDDERRRIARELHDEAGQALTSLIVRLRTLQDARSLREAKAQAARLRRGLADTIGGLGRLARGLHPSLLDDLGLVAVLKRHAAEAAEALAIPIRVRTKGLGSRRLPRAVETALYRIAQEALTNVARHAVAKRVEMVLSRADGTVRLVVRDDGRGFDPLARARGARSPHALGLLGIRERAAALGGTASIDSTPGRGTSVAVAVPLAGARSAARRRPRAVRRRSR
jgi:PAS domain S-box-containing protein